MNEFTDKEKSFLTNLLKITTINPAAIDAAETVAIVQSILGKLNG